MCGLDLTEVLTKHWSKFTNDSLLRRGKYSLLQYYGVVKTACHQFPKPLQSPVSAVQNYKDSHCATVNNDRGYATTRAHHVLSSSLSHYPKPLFLRSCRFTDTYYLVLTGDDILRLHFLEPAVPPRCLVRPRISSHIIKHKLP